MGLRWWWLGAIVVAIFAVVVVVRLLWAIRSARKTDDDLWVRSVERLRQLPRFRSLVAARLRWRRVELVGILVACLGAALLASRLVVVADDSESMKNRDVMLCIDVSSSMEDIDAAVLDAFTDVSNRLSSERIGLVAFDSGAVTMFPLTSDADFIQAHLGEMGGLVQDLTSHPVPGTRVGNAGSSLIGDGLTSCANRFDVPDVNRPRTIVLATDGLVSGEPLFSIEEGAQVAAERDIMVYVISPNHDNTEALAGLRKAAQSTGGDLLTISPGQPTNTDVIVSAVESQQRQAIMASRTDYVLDEPTPGALMICLGLLVASIADYRGRR